MAAPTSTRWRAVLYEMLAGEPPFTGPTAQAMLARRFTETPRPLRRVRDDRAGGESSTRWPGRCAKSPADRFAHASPSSAQALRDGRAGGRRATPVPPPRRRRLPVRRRPWPSCIARLGHPDRPRRAASAGAPSAARRRTPRPQAAGGAPVREPRRGRTTRTSPTASPTRCGASWPALPGLQVTASSSSSQYRKTSKTPQEIGRELGVQYLLTGKVRWEQDAGGTSRVRVSPSWSRWPTASTRWQQPFDAALTDVFQVQADVAVTGGAGDGRGARRAASSRRWRESRPPSLPAYDAVPAGQRGGGRLRPGGAGGAPPGDRILRAGGGHRFHLRPRLGPALARAHLHLPDQRCRRRPAPRRRRPPPSERWRWRQTWRRRTSRWATTTI